MFFNYFLFARSASTTEIKLMDFVQLGIYIKYLNIAHIHCQKFISYLIRISLLHSLVYI